MGQELECRVRLGGATLTGRAQLETAHLLFRGEQRIKLLFKDLTGVQAAAGVLKLDYPGGPAEFELGAAAEKWAHKILHPPTRSDKLGIKEGLSTLLLGRFDQDFLEELRAGKVRMDVRGGPYDLIFLAPGNIRGLNKVPKVSRSLAPDGALWVIYPKGAKNIREIDVIEAGREAGLRDMKVCAFSATRTGLKFVIPLVDRHLYSR